MTFVPQTIISRYNQVFEDVGKHTPFFIQISETVPLDKVRYVQFLNDFSKKVKSFDTSFNYNTKMTLEQLL